MVKYNKAPLRSKTDIKIEIIFYLYTCKHEKRKITHIIQNTNINYHVAKKIIQDLLNRNIIWLSDLNNYYIHPDIIEKNILPSYSRMNKLLLGET